MTHRLAGWAAAAGLMVAAAGLTAGAALPASDPIRVTPLVVAADRVFASFTATEAFDDDARAVMGSGLVLTFTYTVELRRPSTLWFDQTVGRVAVAASVKHDTLTGGFQVSKTQDGRVVWSERTEQDAQARAWMTEFEKIPVAVTSPLEPNTEYYMRVRLHANPSPRFSIWPWGRDDGSGRADFTYIR